MNKDEKTIQTIKELLGENNLDIILQNTNYKDIKQYNIFFKKEKKNTTRKGVWFEKLKNKDRKSDFFKE